jgi:hypothetical protein
MVRRRGVAADRAQVREIVRRVMIDLVRSGRMRNVDDAAADLHDRLQAHADRMPEVDRGWFRWVSAQEARRALDIARRLKRREFLRFIQYPNDPIAHRAWLLVMLAIAAAIVLLILKSRPD